MAFKAEKKRKTRQKHGIRRARYIYEKQLVRFSLKVRGVGRLSLRSPQHLKIMKKKRSQQRKFSEWGFFARLPSRKSAWRLGAM